MPIVVSPVRIGICPRYKGRAASGATGLSIAVSKHDPIVRNDVNVGSRSAHNAAVVYTNVKPPGILSYDQENVRFLFLRH